MPIGVIILVILLVVYVIGITVLLIMVNPRFNTKLIKDNKEKCPYCGEYMTLIKDSYYCMNKDCPSVDEFTIKILKEVAYDYHVKVKKAACGILSLFNSVQEDPEDKYKLYGTIKISENGNPTMDSYTVSSYKFDTEENSTHYIIEYKLYGVWYMSYGYDEISAWANLLNNARKCTREIYR